MPARSESFTTYENFMPRLSVETYASIVQQIPYNHDYLEVITIDGNTIDPDLFVGVNLVNDRNISNEDKSKIMFSSMPYKIGYLVGYDLLRKAVLRPPEFFTEQLREDIQPIPAEQIEEIVSTNYFTAMEFWANNRKLFPTICNQDAVFNEHLKNNYHLGAREIFLSVKRIVSDNY